MNTGILLVAIGKGKYSHWAANMAASLRFHNPDIKIAIAVSPECNSYINDAERAKLYDHVIEVPKEYYTTFDGRFSPGKCKLHIYELSPFERTMYLDVDGASLRPVDELFQLCKGKQVCSQVTAEYDSNSEWWACQWMPLDIVKRVYPVNMDAPLQEINSSFFYFEKGKQAAKYFDTAKRCYIDEYRTTWGGGFPDELAFNLAANITGTDLKLYDEPKQQTPINFIVKSGSEKEAYFIGLYGELVQSYIATYRVYETAVNRTFPKVMGYQSQYKYHHLLRNKFVSGGREYLNKKLIEPKPIQWKDTNGIAK
jgi:hypothetical protein